MQSVQPSTKEAPTHSWPQLPLAPQRNPSGQTITVYQLLQPTQRTYWSVAVLSGEKGEIYLPIWNQNWSCCMHNIREKWILGREKNDSTDSVQYSRCQPEYERGPEKESNIISICSYAQHSACKRLLSTACSPSFSNPFTKPLFLQNPKVPPTKVYCENILNDRSITSQKIHSR